MSNLDSIVSRQRIDALLRCNRNPFISELTFLDTDDLIHLTRVLSGGKWLGEVRRQLNLRTIDEESYIRARVDHHTESVVFNSRW